MPITWICEKCGVPNQGDLCRGCAEPRPIRVLSVYGSETQRVVIDRMSEAKLVPIPPGSVLMFIGFCIVLLSQVATLSVTFWVGLLLLAGFAAWRMGIGESLEKVRDSFWRLVVKVKRHR